MLFFCLCACAKLTLQVASNQIPQLKRTHGDEGWGVARIFMAARVGKSRKSQGDKSGQGSQGEEGKRVVRVARVVLGWNA